MSTKEYPHILAAIILLSVVAGFSFALQEEWERLAQTFFFSLIIITVNIIAKKLMAFSLDADVEHELLKWQRYGIKAHQRLKKPIPIGIILPLVIAVFSLGLIKLTTFLTYETRALKVRAAKRFGFYSYTEMTDWHNGLIGSAGIVALWILALILYLIPSSGLEYFSKLTIYYAFWNLVPVSKLDGTQIFFGSIILWTALALITSILTVLALII